MGSAGTEAGTRGVKIPHHQVPTGKNGCAHVAAARSIGKEILGLFLRGPMAMIGGVLLTPGPLPSMGFYNPLVSGSSARSWGR